MMTVKSYQETLVCHCFHNVFVEKVVHVSFCDYMVKSSLRDDARCYSDWVHTMVIFLETDMFKHVNRNLVLFTTARLGLVKNSCRRSHKEVVSVKKPISQVLVKYVRAKNSSLATS